MQADILWEYSADWGFLMPVTQARAANKSPEAGACDDEANIGITYSSVPALMTMLINGIS